MAPRKAGGCRDTSSYGAGHALPMSGQQVPGFIGSGEPDQARCGDKSRSWVPNLRKSDLLGSDSRGPDPVEGVIKGDIGGRSLVPYTGATAMATAVSSEAGFPTETTPTARSIGLFTAGFAAGVIDPFVGLGKGFIF